MYLKRLFLFLLLVPVTAIAQPQYFTYKSNNKYGITDAKGNEVVPATYEVLEDFNTLDSFATLKNPKGKVLLFHLFTGSSKTYDAFLANAVYLGNEYFSFITSNKKQYLQGQQSGMIIPLNETFYDFANLGPDYVVARFEQQAKPAAVPVHTIKKDKNGVPLPPMPIEPLVHEGDYHYAVFKSDKQLTKVKEITTNDFNSPFSIYKKIKQESLAANEVQEIKTVNMKPWHHFMNERFDYVAVKSDDSIDVYDKAWKWLTKTTVADAQMDYAFQVEAALKQLAGDTIFTINTVVEDVPPMIGINDRQDFLKTEQKDGITAVSYYNGQAYVFLMKTPFKVTTARNKVAIRNGKNEVWIHVDEDAPGVHLPLKYLTLYSIDLRK